MKLAPQVFQLESELMEARKAAGLPPAPPAQSLEHVQVPIVSASPVPVQAVLNGDGEYCCNVVVGLCVCWFCCSGFVWWLVTTMFYCSRSVLFGCV